MKNYILIEDSSVVSNDDPIVITKGTEVSSTSSVDEYGGIMCKVNNGPYKDKKILFDISELQKAPKLSCVLGDLS